MTVRAATAGGVGALLPALLVLAGCASAAVHPLPSTAAATSPSAASADVDPPTGREEVTRSSYRDRTVSEPVATLPRSVDALYLEVACRGAAGSTMGYALQDGAGTPFGPSGRVRCNGPADVPGVGTSAIPLPRAARIAIAPSRGVEAGTAILRRDRP